MSIKDLVRSISIKNRGEDCPSVDQIYDETGKSETLGLLIQVIYSIGMLFMFLEAVCVIVYQRMRCRIP